MNGKTYKLMIVDDSNIMRRRIERSNQFEELELVGTAGNGVEALEIFRKMDPDVVTMDLTMPEMDGIECIAQLLKLLPRTSILVVSALSDKSTAIAALRLGARGFVAKPFSDDELKLALLDVMEVQ